MEQNMWWWWRRNNQITSSNLPASAIVTLGLIRYRSREGALLTSWSHDTDCFRQVVIYSNYWENVPILQRSTFWRQTRSQLPPGRAPFRSVFDWSKWIIVIQDPTSDFLPNFPMRCHVLSRFCMTHICALHSKVRTTSANRITNIIFPTAHIHDHQFTVWVEDQA